MELPRETDLPFFAYGLFRRGQLGFLRLRDFVERAEEGHVKGLVMERDGLPILDSESQSAADGSLFWFKQGLTEAAYKSIAELEPDAQYKWAMGGVRVGRQAIRANVLVGRRPQNGSVLLDEAWDGRTDPLFKVGLDVVRETLNNAAESGWPLRPLFRLQMAYLLLWAAIERYATLRHRIGGNPTARIMEVAKEQSFGSALKQVVATQDERRQVFRADDPKESYGLDPDESMKFYYQIRNNAAHRGKAAFDDVDLVHTALGQLLTILEEVLSAAFDEAGR